MADIGELDANERAFRARLKEGFRRFLTGDLGRELGTKGAELLRTMTADATDRILVDLGDLEKCLSTPENPFSRDQLLEEPHRYMPVLEQALIDAKAADDPSFLKNPKAPRPRLGLTGVFAKYHVTPRGLTADLLNKMICVDGIVTRASTVTPRLICSVHYCDKTGSVVVRDYPDKMGYTTPLELGVAPPKEDREGNPFVHELGVSTFRDTQRITIQEMPECAPTGLLPRAMEVYLEGGLVNTTKPGERVRITAVYKPMPKSEDGLTSGYCKSILVANRVSLITKDVKGNSELQPKDIENIKEVCRRDDTLELLGRSFAPSICGHDFVKKGLILLLMGGNEKSLENGTHLRGDIHALLVGDPSCGKSQMLRFVLNTAPLAVSTTGRGSSGVGLTAAITFDKRSGEKSLEAGAMVLADRGIVCIDEFDKMTPQDRTAIHEVMEQQTVTIAKAGMHVQLNARCSVVAAANPIYGNFDENTGMQHNIGLPDSLLSRFDLIFIVRDLTDPEEDRRIAKQVLKQLRYKNPNDRNPGSSRQVGDIIQPEAHVESDQGATEVYVRGTLYEGKQVLTVSFLRKFLKYCKTVKPDLSAEAVDTMAEFYRALRQRSQLNGGGTLPVTTRLLEACIRLATAHAKLKLHGEVTKEDVDCAKEMVLHSRNEELEAEIPRAAVVEAPAADSALEANVVSREKAFEMALSKVVNKDGEKYEPLGFADFFVQLNQNLLPGVQAFGEDEAKHQLNRLDQDQKISFQDGKVFSVG
jgi:DNA replication licensing factor MCM3